MAGANETVASIAAATSWGQRVARLRQVPQRHGTDEHAGIYAEIARRLYVPHLGADYAYVHWTDFYELDSFRRAYVAATRLTAGFRRVTVDDLAAAVETDSHVVLPLRMITGLGRGEFAASTTLVGEALGL